MSWNFKKNICSLIVVFKSARASEFRRKREARDNHQNTSESTHSKKNMARESKKFENETHTDASLTEQLSEKRPQFNLSRFIFNPYYYLHKMQKMRNLKNKITLKKYLVSINFCLKLLATLKLKHTPNTLTQIHSKNKHSYQIQRRRWVS